MIDDRTMRVWRSIADDSAVGGTPVSLGTVCDACVIHAGMTGGWVTRAMTYPEAELVYRTDDLAGHLDELHMTLGEGPAIDALDRGHAVAATDLASVHCRTHWPVFSPAATELGVRSVLCAPMRQGPVLVGVLGLYGRTGTERADEPDSDIQLYADIAFALVLNGPATTETAPDPLDDGRSMARAVVHQATGMVSAQLDVDMERALARLRAHAFVTGRTLAETAREVVARRLRFSP